FLLAAARRLDAAHNQFQRVSNGLAAFNSDGPGPETRRAVFEIVRDVETSVISLSRAADMASKLATIASTKSLPSSVDRLLKPLTEIRNAYEHIEDRAQGQVRGRPDPEALTIFDWTSLFREGAISYAGHRLELTDVTRLFLELRSYLKQVAGEM